MITIIPGLEISIITLLLLGFSVGVLSGFTGVGGGFVVTPALIVMGMPVNLAVGTSLFWIFLNSLAGAIIHRNLGNTDVKLGIYLALPSLFGVEAGVRLADRMHDMGVQDVAILSVSIVLMLFIGIYTLFESMQRKAHLDRSGDDPVLLSHQPVASARNLQGIKLPPMIHFKRSGVTISLWIILVLGFFIGVMTGLIGTGGGFIIVPAMTYLMGIPAMVAVGSSTVQVLLSSFYGGIRYLVSGSLVIPIALAILLTSIPGVIFGASVTKYVRGVTVRFVLGMAIVIVCIGSMLKLYWLVSAKTFPALQILANIVTFGGMVLLVVALIILKSLARRYKMGKQIPRQVESYFKR